jgi:phthalate 4,5-cis-dihydrodiol dehydrogenase
MIGIGIVGAGFIGEYHARAIRSIDGLRLVAAHRRDQAALARFCDEYGCRAVQDHRDLIADEEVDAVVIATPHHCHTAVTLAAIGAGKPIMLEKPMATNLDECRQILEAARAAQVPGMVGFTNRFGRAYQVAKQILDSGEVGRPVHGVSVMSKRWLEPNRRPWHLTAATGGGMWLTAGIHCLDRLTWLVDGSARQVTARFATRFHAQEADDVGTVLVEYDNGAVGAVVSIGYAEGAPNHQTELVCTDGALRIDYVTGVAVGRGERWSTVPDSGSEDWMNEAFHNQWRAFLPALERSAPSPISLEYGFHIMEAAFAAMESSRTGSRQGLTSAAS